MRKTEFCVWNSFQDWNARCLTRAPPPRVRMEESAGTLLTWRSSAPAGMDSPESSVSNLTLVRKIPAGKTFMSKYT